MGIVMVGLPGSYSDFEPVIARYRKRRTAYLLPYPHDLLSPRAAIHPVAERAFLEMEFDRDRIAAIAAQLDRPGSHRENRGAACRRAAG